MNTIPQTANIIPIAPAPAPPAFATSKSFFWSVEAKMDSIGWRVRTEFRIAAWLAARRGDFETVERLLPLCETTGNHAILSDALAGACENGHRRIVRLLSHSGVRLSDWPDDQALAPQVEAIAGEERAAAA